MKEVWFVSSGEYDCYSIAGVFSTKDKAEEYCSKNNKWFNLFPYRVERKPREIDPKKDETNTVTIMCESYEDIEHEDNYIFMETNYSIELNVVCGSLEDNWISITIDSTGDRDKDLLIAKKAFMRFKVDNL